MPNVPLRLSLHSVLATRTPNDGERFRFGGQLRLAGGPVVHDGDPLLRAFGARVLGVRGGGTESALQLDVFEPGRCVRLETEYDEDGDEVVGVWDEEGIRRAGVLPFRRHCSLVAALDHGLDLRGVVVREYVDAGTLGRQSVDVLVYPADFVEVTVPEDFVVERPQGRRPKRIVLLADGRGEVGFWDPAGEAGPAAPGDLPLSPPLAAELERLRDKYRSLADGDEDAVGFEEMQRGWTRQTLDHRATILWRRARQELGRRFAVGFQGPGMERPVWSPGELAGEDDCGLDIPF